MKVPALLSGLGAGLMLIAVLAPETGAALARLERARADAVRLAAEVATPEPGPLVDPALALRGGDARAATTALAVRVRETAATGGVLVEDVTPATGDGGLARVRIRVSGSEAAVLALADRWERGAPVTRFAWWRVEGTGGAVRLTGELIAPWT